MSIKVDIGNRIREERNFNKLTRKALAELTDDLNISRINNYERGERTPGPQEIKQLAKALNVSPAYLMCLTDEKEPKKIPGLGALIPLLNYQQACDPLTYLQDIREEQNQEKISFIPVNSELAVNLGENAFALKMKDHSMAPELRINDILIIDPDQKVIPGNFVVALLEEEREVIVRQYREISASKAAHVYELRVMHDAWANMRIDNNKSKIIGVVISLIRMLQSA